MHVDNTIFYEKQPYHTVDIAARPPIQSANISIRPMGGLVRPLMVDMNSITSNASSKVIQNPSELSISQQDSVAVRERHIIPASRTPAPTPDAMSRFRATSKLLFTPTGRRQSSTTTHQSSLLLTKPRTAAVHQPDSTVAIKVCSRINKHASCIVNLLIFNCRYPTLLSEQARLSSILAFQTLWTFLLVHYIDTKCARLQHSPHQLNSVIIPFTRNPTRSSQKNLVWKTLTQPFF